MSQGRDRPCAGALRDGGSGLSVPSPTHDAWQLVSRGTEWRRGVRRRVQVLVYGHPLPRRRVNGYDGRAAWSALVSDRVVDRVARAGLVLPCVPPGDGLGAEVHPHPRASCPRVVPDTVDAYRGVRPSPVHRDSLALVFLRGGRTAATWKRSTAATRPRPPHRSQPSRGRVVSSRCSATRTVPPLPVRPPD